MQLNATVILKGARDESGRGHERIADVYVYKLCKFAVDGGLATGQS